MKVRLRANTIRLRLLKVEVHRLAQGETIRETLPTPWPLHFDLRPANISALSVEHAGETVTIRVPETWSRTWAASDEVGRRSEPGSPIDILIEKDWACTTPRQTGEDLDTFPNPAPNSAG